MSPQAPRSAATGTPLQRLLDGTPPERPTALDALRESQRMFQAGRRVDMQSLAKKLGVDRATLYRWVGSREQLLTELIWDLMVKTVLRLSQPSPGDSPPTAAEIITATTQAILTNVGMKHFLDREGELALKLLTTKASDYQTRLIHLVADVIDTDRRAGRLHSAVPAADLPYVIVRIMESYVYLSLITGEKPDAHSASSVIHALMPSTTATP